MGCGPFGAVQEAPHTAQRLDDDGRTGSTDFFASSKICGEMIGSATDFFFIAAFTIEQIEEGWGIIKK